MRNQIILGVVILFSSNLFAQDVDIKKCSVASLKSQPVIDGLAQNYTNKPFLLQDYVEQRDVLWEKKIWRELELSEKMNHHFSNAKGTLLDVLLDANQKGKIEFYSAKNDNFSCVLGKDDVKRIMGKYDTLSVFNPDEEIYENKVVYNSLDQNNLVRYRIKEVWYFDSKHSKLKVKILGIAPIMNFYDNDGNFIAELPLFWIYYPHAREELSQYSLADNVPQAKNLSWDDIFQMRYFSSRITKENNLYDRRISDYKNGRDAVAESDNIHNEIFNYEQDLWER
jgi:gliding motility associated protien GldN